MGLSFKEISPDVTQEYVTVKTASKYSGYNEQYLRRLLREGTFKTRKIGQLWLIDKSDFRKYLKDASISSDKRFGSHSASPLRLFDNFIR